MADFSSVASAFSIDSDFSGIGTKSKVASLFFGSLVSNTSSVNGFSSSVTEGGVSLSFGCVLVVFSLVSEDFASVSGFTSDFT